MTVPGMPLSGTKAECSEQRARTMRDEHTLNFRHYRRHRLHCPIASGAACLGVIRGVYARPDLDFLKELREVPASGAMPLPVIRGPGDEERSAVLVCENLEDAGHSSGLGEAHQEAAVEQLDLIHGHTRCAAPVCPASLVELIVVIWGEIHNSVNEAEDESFCGPVDDDVDSHIVGVNGNFLGIYPLNICTLMTQLAADPGEAGKTHAEGCVTADQLLRSHE
jgi:hypothetical protein